jgi:hypothetical protein
VTIKGPGGKPQFAMLDPATGKTKPIPGVEPYYQPSQAGGQLTPEGLDLAAGQFARTGTMPAMGMGGGAIRTAIINRAAVMFPKVDIAANKADYDANKASLNQMQKTYDSILSFEKTAQKNLDVLMASAKHVLDTGSPLLNAPLRSLSENVFGNEDIPAFRAARRIDVNEIAKIVSNPNMAGVLTEDARHEIDSLVPDQVTMGQLIKVAALMRRDMNNRKTSMEEQMSAIRARISGRAEETTDRKIGDLKKFTNGSVGEWDGKGWVKVK